MTEKLDTPPPAVRIVDDTGALRSFKEIERDILAGAIAHCGGHVTQAVKRLGMSRATVYRRLKTTA